MTDTTFVHQSSDIFSPESDWIRITSKGQGVREGLRELLNTGDLLRMLIPRHLKIRFAQTAIIADFITSTLLIFLLALVFGVSLNWYLPLFLIAVPPILFLAIAMGIPTAALSVQLSHTVPDPRHNCVQLSQNVTNKHEYIHVIVAASENNLSQYHHKYLFDSSRTNMQYIA